MRSVLIAIALLLAATTAEAVNFFRWDFEAISGVDGPIGNGSQIVGQEIKGNTTLTTAQAQTGTHSMATRPVGDFGGADGGNESLGILIGADVQNVSHAAGIYFRFWIKILPGFSWGNADAKFKSFRQRGVGAASPTDAHGYTGYMKSSGFSVDECESVNQVGTGCHVNLANGGGLDESHIIAPYNTVSLADGNWHEIVVFVKPNSSSSAYDAELKVWVDNSNAASPTTTYMGWKLYDTGSMKNVDLMWGSWGVIQYWQLNDTPAGCTPVSGSGPCFFVDNVSADSTFNSTFGGGGPQTFSILATSATYAATGTPATLTRLAGPTLIGFVHRAALIFIILAVLVLWRRRHVHR